LGVSTLWGFDDSVFVVTNNSSWENGTGMLAEHCCSIVTGTPESGSTMIKKLVLQPAAWTPP